MPPRPTPASQPPEPPLNLQNRFIDQIKEERHSFSNEQQSEIDRLDLYDKRKHFGLKNREILPYENVKHRNSKEARETLRRTASFLLIRDVLTDIDKNATSAIIDNDQEKFRAQLLLTAQTESLLHQVAIGKNEVRQKILRGGRFCPMLMQKDSFDQFLRNQSTTIREIVQTCRMFGQARTDRLISNLEKLARSYLNSTNRLPSGLIDEPYVDFSTIRIVDEKVGVWVGTELQAATHLYPGEEFQVALIVIDPEDSTDPTADPADGGPDERYYSLGFEHCSAPEKQAAVFIQKLFFELGDLEVRVAELKGTQPTSLVPEAQIAASSRSDRTYVGSTELDDRCDEWDLDPLNCRKDLVTAVTKLNFLSDALEANDIRDGLLLDPSLNAWVRSPQFEKDMAGIKYPERRSLAVNVECVKQALRESGIFGLR